MNIEEYKDEICRLWMHGASLQEIALFVPFPQSKIRSFIGTLKAEGVLENAKRGRKPKGKKQLVQEAFLQGEHNLDNLANRFGLSRESVMTYLVGLNRGKDYRTDKAKEIALALAQAEYKRGVLSQIAREHNCTRAYVSYVLKNIERYL